MGYGTERALCKRDGYIVVDGCEREIRPDDWVKVDKCALTGRECCAENCPKPQIHATDVLKRMGLEDEFKKEMM